MWPEIEIAKTENRREIVLSGAEISKRIEENGLNNQIYSLTNLNYLSLTDTCLSHLGPDIAKLTNLQTLILHSNRLEVLNENVSKLSKLKILDLSRNSLKTLPDNITDMSQLVSINISFNKLESFPTLINTVKLSVLDLSNNNLINFPDICNEKLVNLSEVKLHGNQISNIPNNLGVLQALKILDLSENKIKTVPGELVDCHKLKELNLKLNPISDRRLFKLIDQCRTKQIIDYVKQNCPRTSNDSLGPKGGKKKGGGTTQKDQSDEEDHEISFRHKITVKNASDNLKVVVENSVKAVREHIVCCIIKNIVFTEQTFKEFIKLQNKLHDGVCEKRNSATIATHDLKKISCAVLKYTTFPKDELKIKPLNRVIEMTGSELFARLQQEANNLRKEKKRSTYSGIHKYLYLIEGKPAYPCLVDEKGEVLSFPPITNSDISKIEVTTSDIFLEVTSSISQHVCKVVLTEVLKELANLLNNDLEVQQVKILDQEEKLKVVFPAKTDLKFENNVGIKVVRD